MTTTIPLGHPDQGHLVFLWVPANQLAQDLLSHLESLALPRSQTSAKYSVPNLKKRADLKYETHTPLVQSDPQDRSLQEFPDRKIILC